MYLFNNREIGGSEIERKEGMREHVFNVGEKKYPLVN